MNDGKNAPTILGELLAGLRKGSGITQNDLADTLTRRGFPYSDNAVSTWERGVACPPLLDPGFAIALADALGITRYHMFVAMGLIELDRDRLSQNEMRLVYAHRRGDQQTIIELAADMGRKEIDE